MPIAHKMRPVISLSLAKTHHARPLAGLPVEYKTPPGKQAGLCIPNVWCILANLPGGHISRVRQTHQKEGCQ